MATCKREIHLGDIGTAFRVSLLDCDVPVDLTGATTLELLFLDPDGTVNTQTASLYGPATDGIIEYLTISGDLDLSGNWKLQAHVVLPTGEWWSDISKFRVYENLA